MKKLSIAIIATLLTTIASAQCSEKRFSLVFDLTSKVDDATLLHSAKFGFWGKSNNPLSAFVGIRQEVSTTRIATSKGFEENSSIQTTPFVEVGLKLFKNDKYLHRVFVQTGNSNTVGWESGLLIQNNLFVKAVYQTNFNKNQFGIGICVAL